MTPLPLSAYLFKSVSLPGSPPQDPLYEYYVDPRSGKQKKKRRPLPPGLTPKQAKLLKKLKRRAHYLDKGFYLCGFRFGWTFFIGIIPGAGDIADAILNYTLIVKPTRNELQEAPDWLVRKMLINNAISAGVGLVPLVGDVALAAWRANSRNANLVEDFLRVKGEENMALGLPNLTPRLAPGAADSKPPAPSSANQVTTASQVQQQSAQGPPSTSSTTLPSETQPLTNQAPPGKPRFWQKSK
ncbi:hypothetical protein IE53DRAFT_384721 [Violaceomyces palustris]|uniref:Uncharacterized protein n=1 Tax=Violaceomyces palustris TaxID=1673888 RepID=A0ACD0P3Y2_9BASI|nr:hypothetical protein IE53DRAFT_384721 [Violaceomyces palustris]